MITDWKGSLRPGCNAIKNISLMICEKPILNSDSFRIQVTALYFINKRNRTIRDWRDSPWVYRFSPQSSAFLE
jgi:hypothetical protein